MSLTLIYTTDRFNQIGTDYVYKQTCKEDKDFFVKHTKEVGTVIMGRKTFEAIGGKPLKDRLNVVLTDNPNKYKNLQEKYLNLVFYNYTDLLVTDIPKYCVIGGKKVYDLFWAKVDVIYKTIHTQIDFGGLVFEPDFSDFVLTESKAFAELIIEKYVRKN